MSAPIDRTPPSGRPWIAAGALTGLGAVAMAAASAHALPGRLDARAMEMVRSAVQMQGWHALAMVACGLWAGRGGLPAQLAGASFLAGTVLFCGAVYAIALGGLSVPPFAPVGGVLLMIGWALLAASALRG